MIRKVVCLILATCFLYFTTVGQIPARKEPSTITQPTNTAITPEKAHPTAKALLTEAFYWSTTEVSAPFGNEEGATALAEFKQWRPDNLRKSPVGFVQDFIADWGYPAFELTTLTLDEISAYITSGSSGARVLIEQDNAVIAVGFGQLVLEGRMDKDLRRLTQIALQRELLPVVLGHFPEDYQPKRRELLSKLLDVVNKLK